MCVNCRAGEQSLWAIGPPYPDLRPVAKANLVMLAKCPRCNQLWLESMFEPFAACKYAVIWSLGADRFQALRDKDQSLTLCQWHEAEVRRLGASADPLTLVHIHSHYTQSRGFIDLRPTGEENAVSLD